MNQTDKLRLASYIIYIIVLIISVLLGNLLTVIAIGVLMICNHLNNIYDLLERNNNMTRGIAIIQTEIYKRVGGDHGNDRERKVDD